MNEETFLLTFKAISNFVNDLAFSYGKRHKPLKLYRRLINQTQIIHEEAIKKHIIIYHNFCITNRDAIHQQDKNKLVEGKLSYSARVYIDMAFIFGISDSDTTPIIWKHLLTISALVDPAGKAKEILRKNVEAGGDGVDESKFLTDIISKVEKNVKPDSNPMEAMATIMNTGIFTDLLSGLQGNVKSGKMDMGKLLGSVQKLVSSMGAQAGDDPEAKKAMGMINTVIGSLGNGNSPPDMANMMSMMSSLMGGMGSIPKVEDITNQK